MPLTGDHKTVVRYLCTRRHRSGQQRRRRQEARYLWVSLAALAVILLSHPIAAAPQKEVRRILILNEVGPSYPAITIINQGIQTALYNSPYHLEFYSEHFDTMLFPDPAVQQEFRDFYLRKYQNRKPDVIVTVGPSPLRFMQEAHQIAFRGVPIVFCMPIGTLPGAPALDSDFTGVENDSAPAETVEIGLRLQPGTEHVVVIGGVSDFDKQQLAYIKQQLKGLADHLDITYMTDLAMPELLERLRHLPRHTLVLLTSMAQDAAGTRFKSNETGSIVAAAANAPVFSLYDVFLNHGEVGGYLSNLSEQGRLAGDMALRMLRGEKPQDIPMVKGVNTYMFDWRALKRWGLKESALPPGSIVLNRQPSVWESYKWYIISGISLILLEALLIGGLVWQRARRRKAETDLAVTYDRLRLAVEAGESVGWDWDIQSGRNQWFGDLQTMYGIPADSYSGHIEDFRRSIHPDDRELVWKAVAGARQGREPYIAEFRAVRADGTMRWIIARGKFYYAPNGDPVRMLGMAVDITERKLAEAALANVSRKLIEAQEQERSRIGRELHDDVVQRLALLSIELEGVQQDVPYAAPELRTRIGALRNQTAQIANDVQLLSHELHSSKLEYLGIVGAAKNFCKEFGERQKVKIDFQSHDMPPALPTELSLPLFRVLQEALRNATKHSGVKHFQVRLWGSSGEIHLTISDLGEGFDTKTALKSTGLGLVSMQERMRLVGGELSIESQPKSGTTIHARVLLGSGSDSLRAAG